LSVQLVSNIFNLCDHNPPSSQLDGQTDGLTDGLTDDMRRQDHASHYSACASCGKRHLRRCVDKHGISLLVNVIFVKIVVLFYKKVAVFFVPFLPFGPKFNNNPKGMLPPIAALTEYIRLGFDLFHSCARYKFSSFLHSRRLLCTTEPFALASSSVGPPTVSFDKKIPKKTLPYTFE